MKKICLALAISGLFSISNAFAQSLISYEDLSYYERLSLEDALASDEPDSVFAIQIWGENYDATYISDSTQVSEEILKFHNLQILEINDQLATLIAPNLDKFPLLQVLTLRNVGLAEFPESVYSLKNLKRLYLQDLGSWEMNAEKLAGNQIVALDLSRVGSSCDDDTLDCEHDIENFPHLQELTMNGNVYNVPHGVYGLKELRYLDISNCNIKSISPEIGNLSSLESLTIGSLSELESLPDEIGNLKSLITLDASGCGFTELPKGIQGCTNLESLILNNTAVLEVPDWIGELTELRTLNVASAFVSTVSENISNCTQLSSIYLWNNTLTEFPKVLFQIPALETIDLAGNSISEIPAGMDALPALNSLDMSNNPIRKIAPDAFISTSLNFLSLSGCNLHTLPDMSGLSNLNSLDLTDDSLSEFPVSVLKLINLNQLNLNYNQIKILPASGWGYLSSLGSLSLSQNNITVFPSDIYSLMSLYSLDISNNQIKKLPKGIGKMSNLGWVRVYGNKGILLPKDLKNLNEHLVTFQISTKDITPKNLAKLRKMIPEDKLELYEY